jgi:hypothetical protein
MVFLVIATIGNINKLISVALPSCQFAAQKDYFNKNYVCLEILLASRIVTLLLQVTQIFLPPRKFARPPGWYYLWQEV